MPTSTNVTNLKINELTENQYDTAVQQGIIGANEISILTDAEAGQVIQVATLPTASADELGNIYQFIGTTDANYTNGYFYKCVSDGQQPATYSWSNVQVQASSGGLPSQTGNAGKFLITDGTDASWSDTATGLIQINHAPGSNDSELRLNTYFTNRYFGWKTNGGSSTLCFMAAGAEKGRFEYNGSYVPVTNNATLGNEVGQFVKVCTKALSNNGYNYLDVPNFEGTFVSVGKVCAQLFSMPSAASKYLDYIVQYIGATDSTYTNGLFYKCVSDGQTPATYSWEEVSMGGGGGLPSQTGQSGMFLTTNGTDASWGNGTHQSLYFRSSENVQYGARIFSSGGQRLRIVAVNAQGQDSGYGYSFSSDTFRAEGQNFNLGDSVAKWGNTYTKKINNGGDITVPAVAGEMAVKQVNATITLAAADWSSNTQTVNVTGMTATGVVMVSPDPTDQSAYTSAGILCTAQAAGTLTFTCDTVPSGDVDVNVVML